MARRIKVGLNSGKKEARLSPMGQAYSGLRMGFQTSVALDSGESAARITVPQTEAELRNAPIEGDLNVRRLQMLR